MGDVLSEEETDSQNPRLKALRAFAAQRPDDPFPRYALAMELKATGDLAGACEVFGTLIAERPDYIASYAPAGEVLVALGRAADARAIYVKGIEACARKNDAHMQGNLKDALAMLDGV